MKTRLFKTLLGERETWVIRCIKEDMRYDFMTDSGERPSLFVINYARGRAEHAFEEVRRATA